MEAFVGSISLFAGNFAPRGWAQCNGQLLPISQNTALFSLLGTYYGGDGKSTFALPDFRGRSAVHVGQGPGLPDYSLGQPDGTETTTMLITQMPSHVHTASIKLKSRASDTADVTSPATAVYATPSGGDPFYSSSPSVKMATFPGTLTTGPTGSTVPFSNLHPELAVTFIICMSGVFPQRP